VKRRKVPDARGAVALWNWVDQMVCSPKRKRFLGCSIGTPGMGPASGETRGAPNMGNS
jgi:hypothetical protein